MKKEQSAAPMPENIPVYVYDDMVARNAHRDKIHWIGHFAMLLVIVFIVCAFLWYLNHYEYVSNETVTVDGATGVANYIGKDGNIYNGEDSSAQDSQPQEKERQVEGNP